MKNITVSIDEDTYRQSRIEAAKRGASVSALVRNFLITLSQGQESETAFDRLARLQEETLDRIRSRSTQLRAADNLPRSSLHDRDALR